MPRHPLPVDLLRPSCALVGAGPHRPTAHPPGAQRQPDPDDGDRDPCRGHRAAPTVAECRLVVLPRRVSRTTSRRWTRPDPGHTGGRASLRVIVARSRRRRLNTASPLSAMIPSPPAVRRPHDRSDACSTSDTSSAGEGQQPDSRKIRATSSPTAGRAPRSRGGAGPSPPRRRAGAARRTTGRCPPRHGSAPPRRRSARAARSARPTHRPRHRTVPDQRPTRRWKHPKGVRRSARRRRPGPRPPAPGRRRDQPPGRRPTLPRRAPRLDGEPLLDGVAFRHVARDVVASPRHCGCLLRAIGVGHLGCTAELGHVVLLGPLRSVPSWRAGAVWPPARGNNT